MENDYKKAFAEVQEVLENSEPEILAKIPANFITFLQGNKDNEYNVNIDFNNENWEETVLPETQAIIALIYRDYISSPEERERLLREEKDEQIKIEKELREKYNPDNIFNKESKQEEYINDTQLSNIVNLPWYKKVFNKILNIFKKNK